MCSIGLTLLLTFSSSSTSVLRVAIVATAAQPYSTEFTDGSSFSTVAGLLLFNRSISTPSFLVVSSSSLLSASLIPSSSIFVFIFPAMTSSRTGSSISTRVCRASRARLSCSIATVRKVRSAPASADACTAMSVPAFSRAKTRASNACRAMS